MDIRIEPPSRHVSSRHLKLINDDEFDVDLNPLESNEHDHFSARNINNFTYPRAFDNMPRT